MSIKIEDLQADVQSAVRHAIEDMTASGVAYSIQSTLRTQAEQAALFAQGRQPIDIVQDLRKAAGMNLIDPSDNTYTVTNCDGVKAKSPHQSGRAIDIVPVVNGNPVWPPAGAAMWLPIANIMKIHGFEWGGDWKNFKDFPHYQK